MKRSQKNARLIGSRRERIAIRWREICEMFHDPEARGWFDDAIGPNAGQRIIVGVLPEEYRLGTGGGQDS